MGFSLKSVAAGGLIGGAVGSLLGGGGGGDAPQIDPRVQANAYEMADTGKSLYSWNVDNATKVLPKFDAASVAAEGIAGRAGARSGDMSTMYRQDFAPVTSRVATDAMGFDSAANLDKAGADAAGQVASAYTRAGGRRGAMMAKYGLNPHQFASTADAANLEQAAAEADASNRARTERSLAGIQLRSNAAQLGRGIVADTATADQLQLGAATAAPTIASSGVTFRNQAVSSALPWYQASNQALLGINQAQTSAYEAEQQRKGQQMAGLGQLVGTGLGFMVGGPPGALLGSQVGTTVAHPLTP